MKQLKIAIWGVIASLLLCGCPKHEDGHSYIEIINLSGKDIAFQETNNKDTTFYCSDIGRTILIGIPADSTFLYKASRIWELDLNQNETMSFFIVDGEKYDKYWLEPCDTIRKYVPVLHRYRLTLEDLQRMNWRVVYPPEE